MNIARKLQELLDKNHLSRSKLAREIGVHTSTITNWLDGKDAKLEKLAVLCDYFGCTIDYLAGEEQKTPADHETDGRSKEFMQLFERLTPEQQDMILAQLRGVVGNQGN